MDSRPCTAANVAAGRARKPTVRRLGSLAFGVFKLHRRSKLPRYYPDTRVHTAEPSLNEQLPHAGDDSAGAAAHLPLTSPSTGARRASRRQQQQELLWGANPAPDAAWQQQQQLSAQSIPALAPPQPPPRPPAQPEQQQQQQSRHSTGAPARDAAAGECGSSDGSGHVGPADLLAQQDAALMLHGGRHRNRQPVVSLLLPQQPPGAAVATAAGAMLLSQQQQQGDAASLDAAAPAVRGLRGRDGADLAGSGDSGGGVKTDGAGGDAGDGPDVREAQRRRRPGRKPPADSARGARLQPGGATAATAVAGNEDAAEGAADNGGADGGDSAGTVSPRGQPPPPAPPRPHVVLRLRRHGPDTRSTRSIRLPLPQRPKPWPVKLLLEAKQREKQQQQQEMVQRQQEQMDQQQLDQQQQQQRQQRQQQETELQEQRQQWLEQQLEPQQPSPGQGQQGRGAQVEEQQQLQRWLGPEEEEKEGGGSQLGLAAAGPTWQARGQEQGRGGELDRQRQRQPEGLGSGLGQATVASPGQAALEPASEGAQRRQDLQRWRRRGAREEGEQRPQRQAEPLDRTTMARVRSQAQQTQEAPTQQQHRQQQQPQQGGTAVAKGPQSQRGRAGQPGDEAPDPLQSLAGASAPAPAAPGRAAGQRRRPSPRPQVSQADMGRRAVGVAEAVAAHPDGTLWAYRRRDVGPLAARLLHQLKQQPLQQGQQLGQQGQQREKRDDGSGAHSGIDAGSNGDNVRSGGDVITDGDGGGGGGGACHVLVAGSYQAYSLLRSLSYVQGALRLASYNLQSYAGAGASGPDGAVGAAAAPPAVGFTASGVSVQDLRSYYEQTVRHGAGPRPELGPPLPPRTSPQGVSSSPGAAPSRPHGDANSSSSGGGGSGTNSSAGKRPPSSPRPLPTLKGWPEDEVQLSPRALVSVFLVPPPPPPPPLDLLYGAAGGGGGGHAAGDDDTPPIAVTARADEATLIRLLTTRLRRHGSAHMRALGREAASRALAVLYGACRALSHSGLTALAFPHMTALGPQPRGELGSPPPPLAAAAAAAGRRRARSAALRLPSPPSPSPSSAAAAAAAVASLDPVLLDKAPQLTLRVVLCEWDAQGRPVAVAVVPERTGLDPPTHTTTPAMVAADPESDSDSGAGSGSATPLIDAEPPPQAALAAPPASSGGGSSGFGAAAAAAASRPRAQPPVRLRVPAAAAAAGRGEQQRRVVVLGPGGGGSDTRGAAAVVAGSLAEGRRVAVAARGLGALLRLPVVVFRAQGRMGKVVDAEVGWRREGRQTRKALVFTLHTAEPAEPGAGAGRGGGAAGGAGGRVAAGGEASAEGGSLVAEVFWLPLSALQHHLHSLPGPPPEPIITRSANRRLLPSKADHYDYEDDDNNDEDGDDDEEEEDGGGDGGGGGGGGGGDGGEEEVEEDQRHVQAAAAAAAAQLARYGTATLEGSSPGRRVTALLAAAGLSAGLRSAAGLTVLVRVPPPPAGVQLGQQGKQRGQQQQQQQAEEGRGQQQQRKAVEGAHGKPSPAWRPPPPRRYQLLLARMDPRVGRLQLLRPEDLSELRRAEATRAAQE
ncbi:hypothetical protein PLESTB_001346200 [Pleodorina starrii]|uniref:Uncharacterized protein n=1 Tax=Pleodorina starrii TaxID=330485 RepID=A0A9W6F764_9CHLO|nr:hypothetical protein PLESTB_001346200 [Pleodorina starrii]